MNDKTTQLGRAFEVVNEREEAVARRGQLVQDQLAYAAESKAEVAARMGVDVDDLDEVIAATIRGGAAGIAAGVEPVDVIGGAAGRMIQVGYELAHIQHDDASSGRQLPPHLTDHASERLTDVLQHGPEVITHHSDGTVTRPPEEAA